MRFLLVITFISTINLYSQNKKVIIANLDIINGDTLFIKEFPEVEILEFKDNIERRKYYILKRRVLKVYPYALVAKEKLDAIQRGLDTIPKRRHKKRYTKQVAIWVKEEYTEQLKNLTMSEGRILVKLIYRETKITSYDIVRSYRGRFNAFFWQTMAKLWENNLKTQYDPVNIKEDMLIEHIILQAKIEGKL
tara:strand:+ start:174 stop:749 length:576 start_codon:yes stop_codon:yes gene_type:complete